ncbi:MAG: rRNA maturation RNase YbeY [Lachnospiraceae bacterium]|nr:rRNA maturation RNase YbeY [Lachnospiraceae bacterium]
MSIFIENENGAKFDFDFDNLIKDVINESATYVNCPFEISVEVTIVDNETIRQINKEQRDIDKATDVLSFPMVDYEVAGNFEFLEDESNPSIYEYFEPDTGELMLGDIVISSEKVYSQAEEYGHSVKRELGFLIAHSMLHLFGYDHMEDDERVIMEAKQSEILDRLGITRD